MISSSSRLWSQDVSRTKTVPIRTFQDLQLEKNMYIAFQNLKHNSNISKKLPALEKQAVQNIAKNLRKFFVGDQAIVTNNGPYFKLQHEDLVSMQQDMKDTKKELKDTRKELNARFDNVTMELGDVKMELGDVKMELGDLKMKVSNIHAISCQSEFLNVLRDMVHVTLDKNTPDGMFSEVTRRIRQARNIEVHRVTLKGCMDACRSFMADNESPFEWEAMFEAFFELSLDEAEMKLIPLAVSSPDFQIEAIMAAQANLLLSCQMDQFPNVFQKWLKAVLEYFDLKQVGCPSPSFPHSTKPELENNSAPLREARKHIQQLAVECLKSEKEDQARAARNGMVTGFPLSKKVLEKRHDKWKEGEQWENLMKLGELYNATTTEKTGGNKRD